MKHTVCRFGLAILCAGLLWACAEEGTESDGGGEDRSLKAWIEINRPDLADNFQSVGEYYVDVISLGETDSEPVQDTVWVRFDFTGRDLQGNICLTRDSLQALQQGTFTRHTHYVPYFRYCGPINTSILEGSYLAMRNELTLGEAYAAQHGYPATVRMRKGMEVVLYMPSSIVGTLSGTGGYEGQYSLDANRPLIVRMRMEEIIDNPLEEEGEAVDAFARANGGLLLVEQAASLAARSRIGRAADQELLWINANDTIPQLYVAPDYFPSTKSDSLLLYTDPYFTSQAKMDEIDKAINSALLERFGAGSLEGDSVRMDGRARIWYIGRFLDGFVFETNIDEVKQIVYGKAETTGTAFSYSPEDDSSSEIQMWYYTVPNLRFGQWAAVLTTSTNAYGSTGVAGRTSSSSSSSANDYSSYYNYYNYYNNYYGNSYYGGYYNGYYGNYMNGYYGNTTGTTTTTATTTTTITEIQAFTPLLYQIYIEPEETDED